jgi:hypothetical protein
VHLLAVLGLLASAGDAGMAPAAPAPETAPTPLLCLERYYGVKPVRQSGHWLADLDGQFLPYDDGRKKTFEQTLAQPDLEDMFSLPYRRGPVAAVRSPNDDPGRVRVEALFNFAYGLKRPALRRVEFLGQKILIHARIAVPLARVEERLRLVLVAHPDLRPTILPLGGAYARRNIAGTDRTSAHSYGIALDISPKRSDYWRWRKDLGQGAQSHRMPAQAIVDAFEQEGFIWGGRWYHFDTMHFEYRPELLDPACAIPVGLR